MSALFLGGAILAEVCGTIALKLSDGFTRPAPSAVVVVGYGISFALLAQALRTIDVGVAYAIWSALGTALVATIGVVAFSEPLNWPKVASLALVVVGVIGLNLSGGAR